MISINVYDDQREIKQHGTYEFPVAVYHYIMSDCVMGYINWHWHEEIQLSLVTKGAICFYADGQQYVIREGEGFFINSGRLHMAKPEGDPDSSYLCLDFHPRLLSSFEGSIFDEKYVRPYISGAQISHRKLNGHHPAHRRILKDVRQIGELYDRAEFGYEMRIRAMIDGLWLELLSLGSAEQSVGRSAGQRHDTVQEIISILRDHYREPVSLAMIARSVGFSESECCRLFKRVTGETILHYLRSYRLTRSIELLEDSDLSVSQIAYESGFSSASYYIESFRKELHQTPLQYRKAGG